MAHSENEIVEGLDAWQEEFEKGWLASYRQTGVIHWKQYRPPINRQSVSGAGINPKVSRVMLISSAGAYLPPTQQPFDAQDPFGDYSLREIPANVDLKQLAYAHDHYDHTAVNADPQVLLPLDHLRRFAAEGMIGHLTNIASFMGYQPDVSRVVKQTIPTILQFAKKEQAQAALLVPS
jgi:hypothetical protein